MITNILIDVIVLIVSAIFSLGGKLPVVTTFPTIGGFDIDTTLVNGVSSFNSFSGAFWPLKTLFTGFLFLMSYYVVKAIIIKFFLGSRTPGT